MTSAEKTTLKTFAKGRKPVKESPKLFKAPAGDQKAENRLGCIKQTLRRRRQKALGRNTSKKNMKKIQVLAAAGLHRQPGLKAILNAMTVYRKDCLAGIVKLSPSDAFKVAKLHWMSWSTGKERCWCVGRAFCNIFPSEISRNHDKPPVLSSFSRRRDSGFARIYIYVCIYIYMYI